jgi:hypothetical protein
MHFNRDIHGSGSGSETHVIIIQVAISQLQCLKIAAFELGLYGASGAGYILGFYFQWSLDCVAHLRFQVHSICSQGRGGGRKAPLLLFLGAVEVETPFCNGPQKLEPFYDTCHIFLPYPCIYKKKGRRIKYMLITSNEKLNLKSFRLRKQCAAHCATEA